MEVVGQYGLFDITPAGLWVPRFIKRNTLMVSWGFAAARALGFGDRKYRIRKIYVEFENVADPDDEISIPSYSAYDGLSYYTGLVAPQDYLRIDTLGEPTLSIGAGFEEFFTDGETGNQLLFRGQTTGTEGANGVEFSSGVNSKIFGIALVAAPDDADPTQDVIVSRGYFDTGNQLVKAASGQVGVTWSLLFRPDSV